MTNPNLVSVGENVADVWQSSHEIVKSIAHTLLAHPEIQVPASLVEPLAKAVSLQKLVDNNMHAMRAWNSDDLAAHERFAQDLKHWRGH